MSVDKETVRRVARLARIGVTEEELAPLTGELNSILAWVEQLQAIDTAGVEPMTSVETVATPSRPDQVTDGDRPDDILKNAPAHLDSYFAVPKVVE